MYFAMAELVVVVDGRMGLEMLRSENRGVGFKFELEIGIGDEACGGGRGVEHVWGKRVRKWRDAEGSRIKLGGRLLPSHLILAFTVSSQLSTGRLVHRVLPSAL